MFVCAGLAVALAFTSCKSSESAYRKAYDKAKAQEEANLANNNYEEAPVVAPVQTRPATETVVVDNVDNVSVRPEKLQVVDGAGSIDAFIQYRIGAHSPESRMAKTKSVFLSIKNYLC